MALTCLHQAALEAKSSEHAPWQWQKYALGYQTRALETFRPALTKITSDNCHAAFGFSVLTKLTALSLLGNTLRDPCESILEMREYVQGIGLIYRQAEEELKSGPFGEIFADLLGEDLSVFWTTSSPRDHDGEQDADAISLSIRALYELLDPEDVLLSEAYKDATRKLMLAWRRHLEYIKLVCLIIEEQTSLTLPDTASMMILLPLLLAVSTLVRGDDAVFARERNGMIHLRTDGSYPARFVLDHGQDITGFPTLNVVHAIGNTSLFSVAHSESRALLNQIQSDGPIAMSAAQNTYRVQHYNISASNSTHTSRLLQGGVRWQILTLSSPGELILSEVGIIPSYYTPRPRASFDCSNRNWTNIWRAGAQTVALSIIAAKSIPDFWQISSEGTLIESAAPQPCACLQAQALTSYQMNFMVKPITGGFSFKVLSDTLGDGIYVWVNLSNSTISAYSGSTEVDTLLQTARLNVTSSLLSHWHNVSASINLSNITVLINNMPVLSFSQMVKFYGSFGIGAANGQSALFTNLTVTSEDDQIYSSDLKSDSALEDFLVGKNSLNVIVDGARRDRIAYAGDLDIAARTIATSNYQLDYINDTLRLLTSNQMTAGYFVPTVKIQQHPRESLININMTGLIGYSFNLLSAMGEYYMVSADVAAAKAYAPAATRMLDWASSQILENGLFNLSDPTFGGDWNYYDPTQSGIVTKFNVVDLTGAYFVSEAQPQGIAQDANAMAILANVPQGNHTALSISQAMSRLLFVDHGALPFSNTTTGFSKLISPYASSYHLRAAFASHDGQAASHLLNNLWLPMILKTNANYTGCFWETLDLDGRPGLGDGTSLCHAWSSGPTAELSRNVLGIQPVAPGFREWRVAPQSLGLTWAKGSQPTPFGDIAVDWRIDEAGLVTITVESPVGTHGTVSMPESIAATNGSRAVVTIVNGRLIKGPTFAVQGGEPFELSQYLG
ncbi:glycoside hydrolase family 78 protein [Aureobasidium pullulans]|nr:glycoside hydrolase family 78 protein [Aureobasidium pullulans]